MKILSWHIRMIVVGALVVPAFPFGQAIAAQADNAFLSTVQGLDIEQVKPLPATPTRSSSSAAPGAKQELQRLRNQNNGLKKQVAGLENRVAELSQRDGADAAAEREALQHEIDTLQRKIKQREQSAVPPQKAGADKALQQLQIENRTLQARLDALMLQRTDAAGLQQKLSALQKENQQMAADLASAKRGGATVKSQETTLRASLAAAKADNEALRKKVAEFESNATTGKRQDDARRRELEKALATEQANNTALSAQLIQAQKTSGSRADAVERMEARHSELEESLREAQEENYSLNDKLTALQAKLQSEHTGAQQLNGRRDELEKSLAAAQNTIKTLTAKLKESEAQLSAGSSSAQQLAKQRDEMEQQLAAAQQLVKQRDEMEQQLAAAQQDIKTLTAKLKESESQLSAGNSSAQQLIKQRDEMEQQLAAAQQDIKTLTAKLKESESQLSAGSSSAQQLARQRDEMEQQLAAAQQSLKKTQGELSRLRDEQKTAQAAAQQDMKQKETQLADLSAQLAQLTPQLEAAKNNEKTSMQKLAALQQQLDERTKQNADLQAQAVAKDNERAASLKASQDEATALKAELAALKTKPEEVNQPQKAAPASINTPLQRHSYAAGIILSEGIEKSLKLQKALGLEVDKTALLAGVNDSITGTSQMNAKQLDENYEALAEKMSAKEKAAYDRGYATLQSTLAGKNVLKQNRTMFFVEKKKGGRAVKQDDKLKVTLTQAWLDGRTVAPQKTFPVVFNDSVPYMLKQAIEMAKKGGIIEVYSFASDMYPADMLPDSLVGFDLLKYTISVAK